MEHALAGRRGGTGIVTKTTLARLLLEIDVRQAPGGGRSRTVKHAPMSSIDHGGGKRRAGIVVVIFGQRREGS